MTNWKARELSPMARHFLIRDDSREPESNYKMKSLSMTWPKNVAEYWMKESGHVATMSWTSWIYKRIVDIHGGIWRALGYPGLIKALIKNLIIIWTKNPMSWTITILCFTKTLWFDVFSNQSALFQHSIAMPNFAYDIGSWTRPYCGLLHLNWITLLHG